MEGSEAEAKDYIFDISIKGLEDAYEYFGELCETKENNILQTFGITVVSLVIAYGLYNVYRSTYIVYIRDSIIDVSVKVKEAVHGRMEHV